MTGSLDGEAQVLGAHLEGPFLNPEKLGAPPPFAIPANVALPSVWTARAQVRTVTFAPEISMDSILQDALEAQGIPAQIGHSLCDYATACEVLERGADVTHLYNAMSGFSSRNNGLCGAAFAHADYAEIIPDLIHFEAGAILVAARRAIQYLYGVTDATAGAGMLDGPYILTCG